MEERSIDRLARYVITLGILAIILLLCRYFLSILIYIAGAFVVSLIGRPVMHLLRQVKIKGRSAPDWLLSLLTIFLVFFVLGLIVTRTIPVISRIIRDASFFNSRTLTGGGPLASFNEWMISVFPSLGPNFDAGSVLLEKLQNAINVNNVTNVLGSVASVVTSLVVGLFSIVFISFFFLRDESLFGKIVGALVPDKIEDKAVQAISDIEYLLSRYFVGLIIEILGVALLNMIALWAIARLPFTYAVGIAFIAGLLNIVPYVGPLIGELTGATLGVIIKYGTGAGLGVGLGTYGIIIFAIMLCVQFVDNFVYQPLIYSTSIKASPLEIFIVLLIAGHVGGILGMLVAIPSYTVVRVMASRFLYQVKPVRRLMPDRTAEDEWLQS